MIVNTRRLFCGLLPVLRIDTICDVGSKDGADALRFRAAVPGAAIYAFEAHPQNSAAMRADPMLRASAIETVELAVSDFDGEAEFFVVEAGTWPGEEWRGMSSLHRRAAQSQALAATRVKTCRLDSFLKQVPGSSARVALWIGAEGKGYEVLAGAEGLIDNVQLVHVEVELAPCITPEQKFYAEVEALLTSKGFQELACDRDAGEPQFNVVFARLPADIRMRHAMRWRTAKEAARRAIGNTLNRICPGCFRRIRDRINRRRAAH